MPPERDLLVRFSGNEGRETGNRAGGPSVEVDPAPLVVQTRAVVAASRPLSSDPVPDAVVQRPAAAAVCIQQTRHVSVTSSLYTSRVSGATRGSG